MNLLFFEKIITTDAEKMDVTSEDLNFLKNYEEKCLKYFLKIRNQDDCKFYYEISYDEIKVYYYRDDEELFDINKDIHILRRFLKKCKFNRNNWNLTDIETLILNSKKEDN